MNNKKKSLFVVRCMLCNKFDLNFLFASFQLILYEKKTEKILKEKQAKQSISIKNAENSKLGIKGYYFTQVLTIHPLSIR